MPAYVYYVSTHVSRGTQVIWGATHQESLGFAQDYLTNIFEDSYDVTPDIVEVFQISTQLIRQAAAELEAEDDCNVGCENQDCCSTDDWDKR